MLPCVPEVVKEMIQIQIQKLIQIQVKIQIQVQQKIRKQVKVISFDSASHSLSVLAAKE